VTITVAGIITNFTLGQLDTRTHNTTIRFIQIIDNDHKRVAGATWQAGLPTNISDLIKTTVYGPPERCAVNLIR